MGNKCFWKEIIISLELKSLFFLTLNSYKQISKRLQWLRILQHLFVCFKIQKPYNLLKIKIYLNWKFFTLIWGKNREYSILHNQMLEFTQEPKFLRTTYLFYSLSSFLQNMCWFKQTNLLGFNISLKFLKKKKTLIEEGNKDILFLTLIFLY